MALIPLIAFFCYWGLLIILLWRGFPRGEARVFALYLVVMIGWSIGSFMVHADLGVLGIPFWGKVLIGASTVMPITFYHFVRVFLGVRKYEWPLYLGYILWGATLVVLATTGYVLEEAYTVQGLYHVETGPAMSFIAAYDALFLLLAILDLIKRYQETKDPYHRNRVRYLMIGMGLVLLGGSCNFISTLRPYPVDIAANIINAFLITYAILRYQLLDITIVIRKGLAYSLLTSLIAGSYLLLVLILERALRNVVQYTTVIAAFLVAIAIAVAFQPLRDRAQLWIDRLFFREKYNVHLMLQELSDIVTSTIDLDRLTTAILDAVIETMRIEKACFLLKDQAGDFSIGAHKGLDRTSRNIRLRDDHPLVHWLRREKKALTRHDIDILPQFRAVWPSELEDLDRMGAELFIPLKAKGELVGILAIGPKLSEQSYSQDDRLTLTTLANQVAVTIENARLYEQAQQEITERKRTEKTLRESEERYRNLFERVPVGLYRTTPEGQVLDVNPALAQMLGYPDRESLLAINVIDGYVNPQDRKQWQALIEHKEAVSEFETCWRRYDGTVIWVRDSARTIRHANGRVLCYEGAVEDITDRKRAEEQIQASLREKEVLLKEIHHRVKNNLQVVSSLLDFQSEYIKDQLTLEMFRESQNRIRSMALIHEQLYQPKDLARIDFAEYIRDLTDCLLQSYGANGDAVTLKIHVADILLGIDTAIPCGLIINELVSNALKYAFPSPSRTGGKEGRGEILVALHSDNDQLTLIVSDNGVGFQRDLDFPNAETLGLRLVNMLSRQLKGTIELDRSDGTTFKITFARPKP